MATMRPPLTPRLLPRPGATKIDLAGKRVLLTGGLVGHRRICRRTIRPATGPPWSRWPRRQDLLDELVGRITENGGNATAIPCDLSDLDAVDALVADVEQRLGGVDILINNAGRSIRRPLAESLERWHDVDRTMVLNYYSPLRLIRGIAPGMLQRGDGHIINVATWGVFSEPSPLFAVYNASKAALSAVSRVIETEWATKGVHSTTLYYPLVATPDDRADQGISGVAGDDVRGGRGLDDHRGAHPPGPDRTADGAGRAGDRPPSFRGWRPR